tara:strand:+ start:1012 stop:2040 length:1029 start_codon:yes stop_codon:yes gene_type:complete
MSLKNLNASNKTHKFLLSKLKDKETLKFYNKFDKGLNLKQDFIVAVSGGPDSLALAFLTKIYSIKRNLNVKYFLVDHKLRNNSTKEANFVKVLFKKLSTNLGILTWIGKKPKSNIQSVARKKRYKLLIDKAQKLKIKYILLGHHKDDLIENFFIRILRGSGLKGIISLDEKIDYNNISLIRPLLKFSKNELKKISKKVFESYVEDPSNKNSEFKRVKIRNFIKNLELEGLDKDKFDLTIRNLKLANETIKFFADKNLTNNSTAIKLNNSIILNQEFFSQPEEVVFRSLTQIIKIVGKKFYPVRGKKIDKLIYQIKNNRSLKITLGNCVFKKVNTTIIVTKER